MGSLAQTVQDISNTLFTNGNPGDGVGLALQQLSGKSDIDVGWTLMSGYLVFFMQAGFAMLCAGSVRAKNAKNIILLNLLDACFGCCAWYLTGYAFAYGDPTVGDQDYAASQAFIGNRFFCMSNLDRTQYYFWFFQFAFAATSATIVSGAVAERCRFEAYMLYEIMLVMFVYPVFAHWVWSPFGWMSATRTADTSKHQSYILLFGSGVYDFAGDGPVHMLGGFASLAGAWVLGPRIGRFDAAGNPVDMPGHNASLTLLGVFLLWFGWYGFNPGSTLAIVGSAPGYSAVSAAVAVNTTIAAAAGTIATLFIAMAHQYFTLGVVVWDLIIAGNGALAGLVAITGGAVYVEAWAAFIIGAMGGFVYYCASKFNLHILKVDDPLDAIAVHAACGAWGMIGTAALAAPNMVTTYLGAVPGTENGQRKYGFMMGGDGKLLAANLIYIFVLMGWTLSIMVPFFWIIKKLGLMRVSPEVEAQGLDVSHHGGSAYPHDRSDAKGENGGSHAAFVSADMIDAKIAEALALYRKDQAVAV